MAAAKQIEIGGRTFKKSEKMIFVEGIPLDDISPIAQLTKLTSLALTRCPKLSDISPLAKCKKVNELVLDGRPR